jgi:hypothetical protein
MLDPQGRELRDELLTLFRLGGEPLIDDAAFTALALRVFAYNHDRVAAYAGYCRARGVGPTSARHWTEIPAVPTAAFKELDLIARGARAERIFRTSGTTRGPERRGEHRIPDLSLYRASLRAGFRAYLLPDDARLPILSLVPSAAATPDSSLAFMIDDVRSAFGAAGSMTVADAGGVDFDRLDAAIREAVAAERPVLLLGTSAAFIHWLDRLEARGERHALARGSRLMDTGGYKGRGRLVQPLDLRRSYATMLGLPETHCINEYGMTEMLSQYYDASLRDAQTGHRRPRRKEAPPWVRSVAVDPDTLEPVTAGRGGLLRHLDLANVGSIAAIQTEDFGRVDEHGLIVDGRAAGAPPRGCSIAMDVILGGSQ